MTQPLHPAPAPPQLVRAVPRRRPLTGTTLFLVWAGLGLLTVKCVDSTPGMPISLLPAPAECVEDDDCTLMPSRLTCCGECPPAPPFEAAPRVELDGLLIEMETDCAPETRRCEPPICEVVAPGCTARARCIAGRCQVEATGCELRVSQL